jgi:hypothetical protein
MDFELNLRFPFKFEFSGSWSLREFEPTSINSSLHKIGQGVLQDGLKTFLFDLVDMHTPSPNIVECMEFPKVLLIKQILEKFSLGKLIG